MDKKAVLNIIKNFRQALERNGLKLEQMILFGSYAKGNYRKESDIDLVVISKDFTGKSEWQRIKILSKAIAEVWQPIEAVAFTPAEWEQGDSIFVDFVKEGAEIID